MNIRLNYIGLQIINIAFFIMSYLFLLRYFELENASRLARLLVLGPLILSGGWVFFTNRIFYVIMKNSSYLEETSEDTSA